MERFEVSSVNEHNHTNIHENDINAKKAKLERKCYKILGYIDNYETANEIVANNYWKPHNTELFLFYKKSIYYNYFLLNIIKKIKMCRHTKNASTHNKK